MSDVSPPETYAPQARRGLPIFVIVAIALLVAAVISMFSIGIFILPIPLAMFGSIAFWSRKHVVAGLVTGAVAASLVFLYTTPITRSVTATKGPEGRTHSETCGRLVGPDLPISECDDARVRSLLLAGGAALIGGFGVALVVRGASQPARRRRAPSSPS